MSDSAPPPEGEPARTPRLPAAYQLIALDSVGSTNDEAKRLANEGAEDGTLVWAREQTEGRGRHGRRWDSPAGNLYLSLIVRPDCPPAEALQLGFAAAVALGAALAGIVPPMTELRYKWPNDVLLNGRKVAGILMESSIKGGGSLDWLVLGLGLNIADHPRESRFPATSLKAEGVDPISVEDALELFCRHFLLWVSRWLEDGFDPVLKAWMGYAYALGEKIEVRLGEETVTGRFAELDPSGALILETDDGGRRTLTYGDVFPAEG